MAASVVTMTSGWEYLLYVFVFICRERDRYMWIEIEICIPKGRCFYVSEFTIEEVTLWLGCESHTCIDVCAYT